LSTVFSKLKLKYCFYGVLLCLLIVADTAAVLSSCDFPCMLCKIFVQICCDGV